MSDEIKVGDRFEIVVEVLDKFKDGNAVNVSLNGEADTTWVGVPKFFLLSGKRLPPVLKVGDRVRVRDDNSGDEGEIVFIKNHEACIDFADSGLDVEMLSDLEPAS